VHLWESLRARRGLHGESEHPSHTELELWQIEHLTEAFSYVRQRIASNRQALRDCLDALSDQLLLVNQLEERIQQHRVIKEVHEHYQHLCEELREAQELLREQRETYRLLRLCYQAARAHLRAEKAIIEQWQEA
jgi:hypothetical protein